MPYISILIYILPSTCILNTLFMLDSYGSVSLLATSEVYSVQHYQYIACVYYMMNTFNRILGGNAAMNLSLNRYTNFKLHESLKNLSSMPDSLILCEGQTTSNKGFESAQEVLQDKGFFSRHGNGT